MADTIHMPQTKTDSIESDRDKIQIQTYIIVRYHGQTHAADNDRPHTVI
jgi:hypothetical protein